MILIMILLLLLGIQQYCVPTSFFITKHTRTHKTYMHVPHAPKYKFIPNINY